MSTVHIGNVGGHGRGGHQGGGSAVHQNGQSRHCLGSQDVNGIGKTGRDVLVPFSQ